LFKSLLFKNLIEGKQLRVKDRKEEKEKAMESFGEEKKGKIKEICLLRKQLLAWKEISLKHCRSSNIHLFQFVLSVRNPSGFDFLSRILTYFKP